MKRFVIFSFAACTLAGLGLAFAPPAHAQTDAPQMVNGKPIALSVTGKGSVEVAPVGFTLAISFYNDAVGRDAASRQNEQAEEKLRQAVLQAGVKPNAIAFYGPRRTGIPDMAAGVQTIHESFVGGRSTIQPTDTVRALRTMRISAAGLSTLAPLVAALQSVKADGDIGVSYDFLAPSSLRDTSLKNAVADAVKKARIMETAAAPRTLRLVTMETDEYAAPQLGTILPLNAAPAPFGAGSVSSNPHASASQTVTLRYALADAPVKVAARTKPAPKK